VSSPARSEIRYAWNGDNALAYQVLGNGDLDLLYLQGFVTNLEVSWENPSLSRFLRELARLSRLIVMDRRGLGCSERFTPLDVPPIEILMDDILVVFDAVDARNPVVLATGDCGFFACPFAATHPNRLAALILYGTAPTWRRSEETPWARTDEELDESFRWVQQNGGSGQWAQRANPSIATRDREVEWFARYERLSCAPGMVYREAWRFADTDIRGVLPSVQVPTLVLHRVGDPEESLEGARYLASHIPGARLVELPGSDHLPWIGDQSSVLREIETFLSVVHEEAAELDRVLATVLFTDIVGSTEKLAELGNQRWRRVVAQHHQTVRALLARYRGTEVDTSGDGFFASFDGPARAVRCAQAIVEAVRPLGLEVRVGLHTGEVDDLDGKIGGIAVNIGARVGAVAGPSEVLVTQTVKDLVAGSGLVFHERGTHELKGVPGRWSLFAASPR
jgi:class 3 adenylate cyclase